MTEKLAISIYDHKLRVKRDMTVKEQKQYLEEYYINHRDNQYLRIVEVPITDLKTADLVMRYEVVYRVTKKYTWLHKHPKWELEAVSDPDGESTYLYFNETKAKTAYNFYKINIGE